LDVAPNKGKIITRNIKPYVGTKDICMMPSVLDIAGLNHVSRRLISNAAGAICGMVTLEQSGALDEKPAIAATMFGSQHLASRPIGAPRGERLRSSGLSR
jgi:uncharacterized protein (UPF0261 family)